MESYQPTIAFFGATGGCANAALARALRDGYKCTALARTPTKLYDLLHQLHVPNNDLRNLSVIQGSISDAPAVRQVLLSAANGRTVADFVLSGIGGRPTLQKSFSRPIALENPSICEEATQAILHSLRALAQTEGIATTAAGTKPLYLAISTTGILERGRDVPVAFVPMYHIALATPHVDKREMEKLLEQAPSTAKGDADAIIENFVIIRPTFLLDGPGKGVDAVRVSWELPGETSEEPVNAPGSSAGSTIQRVDVGAWMMEKVVKGNGEWNGKLVSLTY